MFSSLCCVLNVCVKQQVYNFGVEKRGSELKKQFFSYLNFFKDLNSSIETSKVLFLRTKFIALKRMIKIVLKNQPLCKCTGDEFRPENFKNTIFIK